MEQSEIHKNQVKAEGIMTSVDKNQKHPSALESTEEEMATDKSTEASAEHLNMDETSNKTTAPVEIATVARETPGPSWADGDGRDRPYRGGGIICSHCRHHIDENSSAIYSGGGRDQYETTESSSADDTSEIDPQWQEILCARREQDALIARLREDNAHLDATVAHLESELCSLKAAMRNPDDQPDYEAMVMVEHNHCTADICWRQKYTESLGQLKAVLVELKNELETPGARDTPSPVTDLSRVGPPLQPHQLQQQQHVQQLKDSKVRLLEESIRTLNNVGSRDELNLLQPKHGTLPRSRKRSAFLGRDTSLRQSKMSRTLSGTEVSFTSRAPLLQRVLNLFKKKPSSFYNKIQGNTA